LECNQLSASSAAGLNQYHINFGRVCLIFPLLLLSVSRLTDAGFGQNLLAAEELFEKQSFLRCEFSAVWVAFGNLSDDFLNPKRKVEMRSLTKKFTAITG
jgi:hypothetical protein